MQKFEKTLPDIWCHVFCSQVMSLFSKEEFSCALTAQLRPQTRGAIGEIRRPGGQAKLILGCFELSIKWKCCPKKEQSFHHFSAGYGCAAKALETLNLTGFLNFNFTGCQCNFVNIITDHGHQAVVICSDTWILLCLQNEQPEQGLFAVSHQEIRVKKILMALS